MSVRFVGTEPVLLEGWVCKESKHLKQLRHRWLVLTTTRLLSFRHKRAYTEDATEQFDVHELWCVRPIDDTEGECSLVVHTEDKSRPLRLTFVGAPANTNALCELPTALGSLCCIEKPASSVHLKTSPFTRDAWATALVNARLRFLTGLPAYDGSTASRTVHSFEPPEYVRFEERYAVSASAALLGEGAFGTVHRARCVQSGVDVAVKRVNRRQLDATQLERLAAEVEILRRARHPHVVGLLNHFESDVWTHIVMELLPYGDIFDCIVRRFGTDGSRGNESYTEDDVRSMMRQALEALDHLQRMQVVHRDIKPENVLLTDAAATTLKLADFGMAVQLTPNSAYCLGRVGTRGYTSPEVLQDRPYSHPADLWSLGALLFALLSGTMPFGACDDPSEEVERVTAGFWTFAHATWDDVSEEAKGVVRTMLSVEPSARASAADLLRSRWLTRATRREASLQASLECIALHATSRASPIKRNSHLGVTDEAMQEARRQSSVQVYGAAEESMRRRSTTITGVTPSDLNMLRASLMSNADTGTEQSEGADEREGAPAASAENGTDDGGRGTAAAEAVADGPEEEEEAEAEPPPTSLDMRFSTGLSSRHSRSSVGSVLSARLSGFSRRVSRASERLSQSFSSARGSRASQQDWENVEL